MHQSNITYGYFWLLNHNEFYFCEQNARFTQKRKEPPKIVNKFIKIRIINHVTITMELICESLKLVFKRCTTGHYLIRNLESLMFYTAAVLILIDKTYTTNKKFPKKENNIYVWFRYDDKRIGKLYLFMLEICTFNKQNF